MATDTVEDAPKAPVIIETLMSLDEVVTKLDTYSRLVMYFVEEEGIPFRTSHKGRMKLFDADAIERLRVLVRGWKGRRRIHPNSKPKRRTKTVA